MTTVIQAAFRICDNMLYSGTDDALAKRTAVAFLRGRCTHNVSRKASRWGAEHAAGKPCQRLVSTFFVVGVTFFPSWHVSDDIRRHATAVALLRSSRDRNGDARAGAERGYRRLFVCFESREVDCGDIEADPVACLEDVRVRPEVQGYLPIRGWGA